MTFGVEGGVEALAIAGGRLSQPARRNKTNSRVALMPILDTMRKHVVNCKRPTFSIRQAVRPVSNSHYG